MGELEQYVRRQTNPGKKRLVKLHPGNYILSEITKSDPEAFVKKISIL